MKDRAACAPPAASAPFLSKYVVVLALRPGLQVAASILDSPASISHSGRACIQFSAQQTYTAASLPMKLQPGEAMLKGIVWNSLVGILFLLLFHHATEAQARSQPSSLFPQSLKECQNLWLNLNLFTWPGFSPVRCPCSVDIFNISDPSQTPIFQTTVSPPTSTAEWLVNVTAGASLQIVIAATGAAPNPGTSTTTHYTVSNGSTTCIPSLPGSSTSTIATTTTAPDASSTPSSVSLPSTGDAASSMVSATQTPSGGTSISSGSPARTGDCSSPTSYGSTSSCTTKSTSPTSSPDPPTLTTTSPMATTSGPPDKSLSRSTPTSRRPSSNTIAGVVVGALAVIMLIVLARCLVLRRRRARRRAAGAQALAVSPHPSYLSWLPLKPRSARSSYQASQAESLCSDSQLSVSVAESKQPLTTWNPRRFVREQTDGSTVSMPDAGARFRLPRALQHPQERALPSASNSVNLARCAGASAADEHGAQA